jgi:hypothetical protein
MATESVNIFDGEIERKATKEEIAYIKKWQTELNEATNNLRAEIELKEQSKLSAVEKLKTLGLTAEEINAIL